MKQHGTQIELVTKKTQVENGLGLMIFSNYNVMYDTPLNSSQGLGNEPPNGNIEKKSRRKKNLKHISKLHALGKKECGKVLRWGMK